MEVCIARSRAKRVNCIHEQLSVEINGKLQECYIWHKVIWQHLIGLSISFLRADAESSQLVSCDSLAFAKTVKARQKKITFNTVAMDFMYYIYVSTVVNKVFVFCSAA